jgi:HPt (histidine-containing phosphotransfer) domain-containing protein
MPPDEMPMSPDNAPASQLQQQPNVFTSGVGQDEVGKVIDVEAALSRMGRDRNLLEDLAEFFLEDAPVLLVQLRDAVRGGRAEDVGQTAHSLKGLVANFDATRAHELAAEMEQHGWSKRIDSAQRLLDDLDRETNRVMLAVRAEILANRQ